MLASVVFYSVKCIAQGSFRLLYFPLRNQLLFIYFMYKGVLFKSMSGYHMCTWCLWMPKKSLDPLELEQMDVSYSVGARPWTLVLCKDALALTPLHLLSCYSDWFSFVCDFVFCFFLLLSAPSLFFCFYYTMLLEVSYLFLLIWYLVCFLYLHGCVLLNLGNFSSMIQLKIWSIVLTWDFLLYLSP